MKNLEAHLSKPNRSRPGWGPWTAAAKLNLNPERKNVMAVKAKRTGTPGGGNLKDAIMAKAAELWDAHSEEVLRIIKNSEDHKVTVGFSADIDCSESAPSITIKMRFSETFTDSRKVQLDDPNQGTFTDVVAAAEKEPPKKRGRNQSAIDEATE